MTKSEFYKELKDTGVDVTDPIQMKVWSAALLHMAQGIMDSRYERCVSCHYTPKKLDDGTYDLDTCPNNFCPMKFMPNTPAAVVDWFFERDEPLNMSTFFSLHVKPILDKLIERENNARNQDS